MEQIQSTLEPASHGFYQLRHANSDSTSAPSNCCARNVSAPVSSKPLIVTDPGVKAAGILQKAVDAHGGLPHAVFDQTPSNPTEAAVRAAAEISTKPSNAAAIAVGGGSAIDCARGVAIAAARWPSVALRHH